MESNTIARNNTALAWAVLVTAIVQAVAPLLTFNGANESPGQGAGPDLLITPAGWAFSIWGVIYLLAIVQGVAVVVTRASGISARQQIAQIVLYLGATLWILMATVGSSVATASALLVMFLAAIVLVVSMAHQPMRPGWLDLLTRAAAGLYCGWVTAAFFLNVSTALVDVGVTNASEPGWQLVVLGIATVTLATLVVVSRANLAFAAAGLWALIGIIATGRTNGTSSVVTTAAVAAVVLLALTGWARWATHKSPA